jgi:hypothetical protein
MTVFDQLSLAKESLDTADAALRGLVSALSRHEGQHVNAMNALWILDQISKARRIVGGAA